MSEVLPDQQTVEEIRGLIEELFALAPEILGIDEAISGCQVINMDPYAAGVLPRDIRVSLRGQYHVDAYYWGNPALAVGDFCTVLHIRDGDRYEVAGGGATSILPWLAIWQYDISLGVLIPHATIAAALAACAAGDYVLIPPGTFDEAITLVTGVYVVEQIPGTVILNCTAGATAVTCAAGAYINIKEIRVVRNAAESSYAVYHSVAGALCRVIAERIYAENNNAAGNPYGVYFNSSGLLDVYAKELEVSATGLNARGVNATGASSGDLNLWIDKAVLNGDDLTEYVYMNGSGTLNVYGTFVELTTTQAVGGCIILNGDGGTLNAHDIKGLCTRTNPGLTYCVIGAGAALNIYDSIILSSNGAAATHGVYVTSGTTSLYHTRVTGHNTFDLNRTGGTLNVHRCNYDTTNGTISYLSGDRRVQDLDDDTYISALAVDDQIDVYIAGAQDFTWTANSLNVLSGSRITMADDTWIGLGAAAGRITFDSTPAVDQVQLDAADLTFDTALGIIHPDAAAIGTGCTLVYNGTRFVPGAGGIRLIAETQVGGAGVASVTFAAIAGIYRYLLLKMQVRTDRAAEADVIGVRFNGDSGNNYDWMRYYMACGGALLSTCSRATSAMFGGYSEADNSRTDNWSPSTIWIYGYAETDREKWIQTPVSSVFGDVSVNADMYTTQGAGRWRNTNAVTSITLFSLLGSTIVADSIFTLYGIL